MDTDKLVCSLFVQSLSHVLLFATVWTIARQAPLPMGFSGQEHWNGLPCSPPGDLPDPGIELGSLMSPALAGGFFTTSTTWEAPSIPEIAQKKKKLVMSSNHLILCHPLLLLPSISFSWNFLLIPIIKMRGCQSLKTHLETEHNFLIFCFLIEKFLRNAMGRGGHDSFIGFLSLRKGSLRHPN